MTQDIDDLIERLEKTPHDSLCAARWPDSSVPCYCDRSVKRKAAAALREQRDEIAALIKAIHTEQDRTHRYLERAERAEAEIARLTNEISARSDLMQGYLDCWRNDKTRAERAEAERDALREDAKRWRWYVRNQLDRYGRLDSWADMNMKNDAALAKLEQEHGR